ncbi:MAG: HD-GYP domain-containing protein [Nitrospiraceae bacterium]
MHVDTTIKEIRPVVLKIQGLLQKIDRLQLPSASRRDVESILVRQVSKEIDRELPRQAGHERRTAAVAIIIGQAVALEIDEMHHLELAALLHDIGLLMLPPHLMSGIDSLEPESYVAIQNHSRLGATLLEPFSFLREAAILIAHHHERWDGSGYPYGIRGEYIPFGARILAIADAFDAIHIPVVSEPAVRNMIALRILGVAAGTQFDPHLVTVLTHAVKDPSLASHRLDTSTTRAGLAPLKELVEELLS